MLKGPFQPGFEGVAKSIWLLWNAPRSSVMDSFLFRWN